jgi:hypothetical protein
VTRAVLWEEGRPSNTHTPREREPFRGDDYVAAEGVLDADLAAPAGFDPGTVATLSIYRRNAAGNFIDSGDDLTVVNRDPLFSASGGDHLGVYQINGEYRPYTGGGGGGGDLNNVIQSFPGVIKKGFPIPTAYVTQANDRVVTWTLDNPLLYPPPTNVTVTLSPAAQKGETLTIINTSTVAGQTITVLPSVRTTVGSTFVPVLGITPADNRITMVSDGVDFWEMPA